MKTLRECITEAAAHAHHAPTAFLAGCLMVADQIEEHRCMVDSRLRDLIALLKPDVSESVDGMDQTPTRPADVALTDADDELEALRTDVAALIDSNAYAGALRSGLALLIGRKP